MRTALRGTGWALIIAGILLAATGPFWIGTFPEFHAWSSGSWAPIAAGAILILLGVLMIRLTRSTSEAMRRTTTMVAAVIGFVFMVPAAYGVGCACTLPGHEEDCDIVFSNIAGVPIPLFNWFVSLGVAFGTAALVWTLISRRIAPTDD